MLRWEETWEQMLSTVFTNWKEVVISGSPRVEWSMCVGGGRRVYKMMACDLHFEIILLPSFALW